LKNPSLLFIVLRSNKTLTKSDQKIWSWTSRRFQQRFEFEQLWLNQLYKKSEISIYTNGIIVVTITSWYIVFSETIRFTIVILIVLHDIFIHLSKRQFFKKNIAEIFDISRLLKWYTLVKSNEICLWLHGPPQTPIFYIKQKYDKRGRSPWV